MLFNVYKVLLVFAIGIGIGFTPVLWNNKYYTISAEGIYLIPEVDTFNRADFESYLKELNIKFVDVAIAQSMEETGHWQSVIFKESNNLFGMKFALVRPRTAVGELRGHALYKNWRESCIDYALFQARYAGKIRTEEQYLDFLGRVYATNPEYKNNLIKHLRKIRYETNSKSKRSSAGD